MEIHFLTLFPDQVQSVLKYSVLERAVRKKEVEYKTTQIRDFANDKHRSVDAPPYGGGEGMLLRADVLSRAWQSIVERPVAGKTLTVLLSPQGSVLNQAKIKSLACEVSRLILVCGHYEGVDQRFIEQCVDEELSIGDYVLTGGELPALVVADAVTRFLPGVLGNDASLSQETFEEDGLLKYPQFTKPREVDGKRVPEVLLSGNHQEIARWRRAQREVQTQKKRPDLWEAYLKQKSR